MNKHTIWIYFSTTITNVLCLILGTISGILSARLLGPAGRGELAILLYFPSLMGTFFCLAVPQALTFIILKRPEQETEIIRAGLRLSVLLGIVGALCFALVAPYTLTKDNMHLAGAVSLICLAAPAMVVNPHMTAIFQGLQRFDWVNAMQLLAAGLYVILLLGLWLLEGVSPLNIALASLGLQLFTALIQGARLGSPAFLGKVHWATYRVCSLQGLKFFLPVMTICLFTMSDRAILIRTTTLVEIGYYSIALALTYPLVRATEAFTQIGFVEVAHANDDRTSTNLMVSRFHLAQITVAGAALFVALVAAPLVRYAFGTEFLPAMAAIYFMIVAMSLRGLSRALENSLRARNWVRPGVVANLAGLLGVVSLGALWVPQWGAAGFGLALLCAQCVSLGVLLVYFSRLTAVQFRVLWGFRLEILAEFTRKIFRVRPLKEANP